MDKFFELRDDDGVFTFSDEKFQFSIEVLATKERLESLQSPSIGEECRASILIPITEAMDNANMSIESDQIGNERLMDMSVDLNAKTSDEYLAAFEREA